MPIRQEAPFPRESSAGNPAGLPNRQRRAGDAAARLSRPDPASRPVTHPPLDPRHAVYAGTFDPVTLGHEDIIRRGARLFERLTVGVGINPDKTPLFPPAERVALLREVCRDRPNVTVETFDGLTVDFTRSRGAAAVLRGVRSLSDMEAELTLSLTNRTLAPEVETVFLMAHEHLAHVSSTLIKQIARFGGAGVAGDLERFVPPGVIAPLLAKYRGAAEERGAPVGQASAAR